jgi:hypothetical protein
VLRADAVLEEAASGSVRGWGRLPLVGRPRRKGNKAHSLRLWSSLRGELPLKDSTLRECLEVHGVATVAA